MTDAYPYRNVTTGLVQNLTETQAAVFPGQFDKLAEDYEVREATAAEAAAQLDAAKADGSKAEVKDAKAAAAEAQAAADAAVVEPAVPASTDAPKEA